MDKIWNDMWTKSDDTNKNYSISTKSFEVKKEDDSYFYIEGYASTFGNIDRGGDVIIKGAFTESIKTLSPSFLWMHSFDDVIGVVDSIKEDDIGLFVKCRIPKKDSLVQGRVIPQLEIGSVKSFSIGFYPTDYKYDNDGNRLLSEIELLEVSLVPLPMNPEASITSAKKLDIDEARNIKTKRDFERALRDLGASNKSAVYLASFFKDADHSEYDDAIISSAINQLKQIKKGIQK